MAASHASAVEHDVRNLLSFFDTRFDRNRLLGPQQVVAVLMTMIREGCGYQRAIDLLHERVGDALGWGPKKRKRGGPPSAGAFCRARHNLPPALMLAAYREALASPLAVSSRDRWRWKGHRLLAADGVRYLLPATAPIIEEWGRPKTATGEAYQPQLLQVALWDVGAIQPVAWTQAPCHGKGFGERTLILRLLDGMQAGDVLLLDRGFPSRRLLHELVARGIHFVIRMTAGGAKDFAEVRHFLEGRSPDAETDITYHDQDTVEPLIERLRLVRRRDADGTVRVLITDLRDQSVYTKEDLFEVYRRRWGIENAFRDIKIRYEAEHFHGTTPNLIEQEIITVMMVFLMESMVEEAANQSLPRAERPIGDDDRPKRHNRAALGDRLTTAITVALHTRIPRHLRRQLMRTMSTLERLRSRVRRPRSYPRICKSQYGRWRFDRRSRLETSHAAA